jgi:hypothetical protein
VNIAGFAFELGDLFLDLGQGGVYWTSDFCAPQFSATQLPFSG